MISKGALPIIHGERLFLRPLTSSDLPMTLSWRNQDEIRRWFFHSEIITPEQHQAWFESYRQKDDDFVFIIEEKVSLNRAVGQAALYQIDWERMRAEFGRFLIGDPEARGMRLAKEATEALLTFAETDLGMQEVYLRVYATNLAALHLYRACGFSVAENRDSVICMTRRRGKP